MMSKMDTEQIVFYNTEFKKTARKLKKYDIECIKNIEKGKYGAVFEIKHPKYMENLAAKFILSSDVSSGESVIWKNLHEENMVPLLESFTFKSLKTTVFLMPLYKKTLFDAMKDEAFRKDSSAFYRGVSWIKNVISAVAGLHQQGICHLDVKSNNILIDDFDEALLTDFGFATKPLALVDSYGTPSLYRPPEAIDTAAGLSLVDGFALDKWAVGTLAVQIFTYFVLLRVPCPENNINWARDVYPALYSILQVDRFKVLLNSCYINSNVSLKTINNVLGVIKSLLVIDPTARPELREVLNYPLFGGTKTAPSGDDIWKCKAQPEEIEKMVGVYSPNPLMGVEELIERKMMSLKDDCADQELLSEESAVLSAKIERNELSADVSSTELSTETNAEKENMPQDGRKKTSRCKQIRDWIGRKRASIEKMLRSCFPHRSSRK